MRIRERGVLVAGQEGTALAVGTFPALLALSDGTVLASYRAGSTKDSEDETVRLLRSADGGRTWSQPVTLPAPTVEGKRGSLKLFYLTELSPTRLLGATMWVDRETYPGKPLFNPDSEGCLPMAVLLADSSDQGRTWSPWRLVPMPAEIGPPSLTNPILKLRDGTLAMSIETNKHYHDRGPWRQYAVLLHSKDNGWTWTGPTVSAQHPAFRIFNWDLRACVSPDGRIATFAWTYDTQTKRYVNIHRRISSDGGRTWSAPEDLGITDQAGPPAVLPDGSVLLPWVDRFQTHSIRVRWARDVASPFEAGTEQAVYTHGRGSSDDSRQSTGELLSEMGLWTFGLPYAARLPDGDVMVLHYAGTPKRMDICCVRLEPR